MNRTAKRQVGAYSKGPKGKTAFLQDTPEESLWGRIILAAVQGFTSAGYTKEGEVAAMSSHIVAQRSVEIADLVLAAFKDRRVARNAITDGEE